MGDMFARSPQGWAHIAARAGAIGACATAVLIAITSAMANPGYWRSEWPKTDFSRANIDLTEIRDGGPPKDGIPPIDDPQFDKLQQGVAEGWSTALAPREPVIGLEIDGDARAYPLRILMWHEIVNDTVGGHPVVVTYCPLCNAALVFDRSISGKVLNFGTTGKLRHSDLVMYDRQSESWWQQFTGEAIIGLHAGARLKQLPSRLEAFERFAERHPDGRVLRPNNPRLRNYGANPYVGYDREGSLPFLYSGTMPEGIEPMARVVAVETAPGRHEAFALSLLRAKKEIRSETLILRWAEGQTSALDETSVAAGRDVGNVVAQREENGKLVDIPYDVTFAFAFHAFRPHAPIHR